jgi:serine/threonine-protein kinase RsbW
MIAISLRPPKYDWGTMSFASTLYLCPILDLLLAKIPEECRSEVRLGLQEALVNAATHGNNLDPSKAIVVQYSITDDQYSWIISDKGSGFNPSCRCTEQLRYIPPEEAESGRGMCILHQVFDQVHWNHQGTKLRLCKQVSKPKVAQTSEKHLVTSQA